MYILLCFFYENGLFLFAFPTRRSSDLFPNRPVSHGGEWGRPSRTVCSRDAAPEPIGIYLRRVREGQPRSRSEEHTSELQSRGHLVCRLLFEKKNIIRDNSRDLAARLII